MKALVKKSYYQEVEKVERSVSARVSRRPSLVLSVLLVSLVWLCFSAPSASALPERFFGMTAAADSYFYGPEYGEPNWAAMQKAGVQKFRLQIKWSDIAAAGNWKDHFAYEETYDHFFENAAKHGIAILPYIYGRKVAANNEQYYLESDPEWTEWLEFVAMLVRRYGEAGSFWEAHPGLPQYPVTTWEIWNEPNLKPNCPNLNCSGETYGNFLVKTSARIRNAAKTSFVPQILFGGLFMEHWGSLSISQYLNNAAKVPGIKAAYNGLSIHPYSIGQEGEPGETLHTYSEKATGVWSNIDGAYNAQANAETKTEGKLGAKPLWITEVGWPVNEGTNSPYDFQHVDEGEQAGLLNETYNWTKAHFSEYNIKYVAWYFYQDINERNWAYNAGIRNRDGDFRQSWFAYEGQTGAARWPANFRYSVGASNGSSFSWNSTSLKGMSQPIQMGLGDVTGDGKADIVGVENEGTSGKYRYMLGASSGINFSWNFTSLTGMGMPVKMALGDVTGDGKADIVGVEREDSEKNKNEDRERYRYMLGVSSGNNFSWNFTKLGGMSYPVQMGLGDVNGDGKADIVAVEREDGTTTDGYRYMIGMSVGGDFEWIYTSLGKMSYPIKMALGDVTGDGKADIVAVEREASGAYRYMLGISTGNNFSWNTVLSGMSQPTKLALGDVNGDKKADIVAMEKENNESYRYMLGLWNGTGFSWNYALTGMGQTQQMGLADINGDGKADIVGAESAETAIGPTWRCCENVGGAGTIASSSSPDVASPGPGKLDLFARGTDGALWHKTWSGNTSSGWSSLGGSLKAGSGPGAMSKAWPTVDVFGRAPNDTIVNWYYDGTKWNGPGTTVPTTTITSDPDLATAVSGQLDAFARGTTGSLMRLHWNGSSWSAWENLGGTLKEGSGPTAVSKSPGTLDVFGRATNNSLVNWYYNGSVWSGPGSIEGSITSDPDVASLASSGTLDVFARGADGALWHKTWTGSTWTGWSSLGGSLKEGTGPTAVSKGANEMDVFGVAPDGSIVHWYYGTY